LGAFQEATPEESILLPSITSHSHPHESKTKTVSQPKISTSIGGMIGDPTSIPPIHVSSSSNPTPKPTRTTTTATTVMKPVDIEHKGFHKSDGGTHSEIESDMNTSAKGVGTSLASDDNQDTYPKPSNIFSSFEPLPSRTLPHVTMPSIPTSPRLPHPSQPSHGSLHSANTETKVPPYVIHPLRRREGHISDNDPKRRSQEIEQILLPLSSSSSLVLDKNDIITRYENITRYETVRSAKSGD